MPALGFFHRVLFVIVLSLATATVMLPVTSVPAEPVESCCPLIAYDTGDCPLPVQEPSGPCCGAPVCLHLFLQTHHLSLAPGSTEMEWAIFVVRENGRAERPAVPPPRV